MANDITPGQVPVMEELTNIVGFDAAGRWGKILGEGLTGVQVAAAVRDAEAAKEEAATAAEDARGAAEGVRAMDGRVSDTEKAVTEVSKTISKQILPSVQQATDKADEALTAANSVKGIADSAAATARSVHDSLMVLDAFPREADVEIDVTGGYKSYYLWVPPEEYGSLYLRVLNEGETPFDIQVCLVKQDAEETTLEVDGPGTGVALSTQITAPGYYVLRVYGFAGMIGPFAEMVYPTPSSGGTDPALEGRVKGAETKVSTLESNVTALRYPESEVEILPSSMNTVIVHAVEGKTGNLINPYRVWSIRTPADSGNAFMVRVTGSANLVMWLAVDTPRAGRLTIGDRGTGSIGFSGDIKEGRSVFWLFIVGGALLAAAPVYGAVSTAELSEEEKERLKVELTASGEDPGPGLL